MNELLAEATRREYEQAQLWTQQGNERARRLYESLSFQSSGREKDYEGEHIVHYERALGKL